MIFYSGFSLKEDKHFFDKLLVDSDFCIAGFSYGAIKAFHKTEMLLKDGKRVDRLQLFSPAFFQTKLLKFKKLQLKAYGLNEQNYIQNFLKLCFKPYVEQKVENVTTSKLELEELLFYEWDKNRLEALVNKGVKIEVYLGSEDKVIDVDGARKFFKEFATVTYIKNKNHFLKGKELCQV